MKKYLVLLIFLLFPFFSEAITSSNNLYGSSSCIEGQPCFNLTTTRAGTLGMHRTIWRDITATSTGIRHSVMLYMYVGDDFYALDKFNSCKGGFLTAGNYCSIATSTWHDVRHATLHEMGLNGSNMYFVYDEADQCYLHADYSWSMDECIASGGKLIGVFKYRDFRIFESNVFSSSSYIDFVSFSDEFGLDTTSSYNLDPALMWASLVFAIIVFIIGYVEYVLTGKKSNLIKLKK